MCPGCAEAHEWHLVQPGYGTLEQEPIGSGTGSVTWHCWQVIPAWFPESIGKQTACGSAPGFTVMLTIALMPPAVLVAVTV